MVGSVNGAEDEETEDGSADNSEEQPRQNSVEKDNGVESEETQLTGRKRSKVRKKSEPLNIACC